MRRALSRIEARVLAAVLADPGGSRPALVRRIAGTSGPQGRARQAATGDQADRALGRLARLGLVSDGPGAVVLTAEGARLARSLERT